MRGFITFFSLLVFQVYSFAAVFAPSAQEVTVSFVGEFITDSQNDTDESIASHYQHLFGYFHSPTVVGSFQLDPNLVEGIGGPKMPMSVKLMKEEDVGSGKKLIQYKVKGQLLLHKAAAKVLVKQQKWQMTLPYDLDNFYDEKCTDEHYNSFGDFWYFYDPFRKGCGQLRKAPLARPTVVEFLPLRESTKDYSAMLNQIRGDNGNGDLFQIVTINGFAEDTAGPQDDGRVAFEEVNEFLKAEGFKETILAKYKNRPVHRYEKTVTAQNGQEIKIQVTRLLADTSITSQDVTFAKFFKNAVQNADVLIYAGHSGLGGNLDIPSLEEKVGEIQFNQTKKQIFFFDGCSSYSYYLKSFADQKKRSNVDIMTNGLSSLFVTEFEVHSTFLNILFQVDTNPTWSEILTKIESSLDGATYLLNVGAL
ncbi:MAG: hypothetical protein BroJett040_07210 [Oligoflexia bacterium]|nr:MAG: hypothetical protein BroJett040_07210 [Oligoflexia bacterium]